MALTPSEEELLEEVRRTVAHDLRTPLAVILGQCELAGSGGSTVKALAVIRRQSEGMLARLDALADDLNAALKSEAPS